MRPTLAILLGLAAASWSGEPAPAPVPAKDQAVQAEQTLKQAFLGISMDEVDEALAYHLKLENDLGILVREVTPGSSADKMGIKTFDVVVACDGKPIYTPRAMGNLIKRKKAGDTVEITLRRGAETVTVTGALQARPATLEERPNERRMMPDLRRLHEMLNERDGGGNPRHGRVEKPDGSVMEWAIEDPDTK